MTDPNDRIAMTLDQPGYAARANEQRIDEHTQIACKITAKGPRLGAPFDEIIDRCLELSTLPPSRRDLG
jgi:hypothetical protein